MLLEELFFEFGAIIIIAAALSMLIHRLRLPLIIAYIVTGIVAGPGLLALSRSGEIFSVMSEIGVAFLLFTVGLGLNWRAVKDVGAIALATGIGQVVFTTLFGYFLGQILGLGAVTSIYLAIACAFSSTIIIVKLLMDKEHIDLLYGRISVGFLLVQDFIAMFILLGLGAFSGGASIQEILTITLLKTVLLVPLVWVVSAKIVPHIVRYAAKSQELLFIFAIAWCFLIAGGLTMLGFGIELGALIAGVTLSGTMFEREINARIRPLRDFFLIIFFIVLGTHLGFDNIGPMIMPIAIFSVFILIGNPIIVMIIMRLLGYHPRTGFLAGTTVAQISEFSFIVLAAGIAVGHIESNVLVLATAVGLITIAASSYLIENNEWVYDKLSPLLKWLEPKEVLIKEKGKKKLGPKIVLFGYEPMGKQLLKTVHSMKQPYIIVDFDPQVARKLEEKGEPVCYGDAGDDNFLLEIEAHKSKILISTIPDLAISMSLLTFLKSKKFKGASVVAVHNEREAEKAYDAGATYVIVPSVLGGERLRDFLTKSKIRKTAWSSKGKVDRKCFIE